MRLQVELLIDDAALELQTLEFNEITGDLEATVSIRDLKDFMQSQSGHYHRYEDGVIQLGCDTLSLVSGMACIVGEHRIGLYVGEISVRLYDLANITVDYVDITENWSMTAAKPIKIRITDLSG